MSTQGMTGASPDAVEFLTSQHRQLDQLWTQLQTAHSNGSDAQVELSEKIVALLSQHDAIETQFLYPELRKSAGEAGQELSADSLEDHQVVRELLVEVDGRDIRDESIFQTLSQCVANVKAHVAEEEQEIFPLLRQVCDQQRLTQLGEEMSDMMRMAPTHPHPHTPESKVGAAVAGTVSGLMDKARDAVRDSRK